MLKLNTTDEKCRAIIDRLISHLDKFPEGNFNRLLDKTLIGFNIEERWIDFRFVADERHINIIGAVHGGIMAGLADECMGYGTAALIGMQDESLTTCDMQFNCLKAVYKGDELRVHVSLKHLGRRFLVAGAEIFRGDELVFIATENLARIPQAVLSRDSTLFQM